MEREEKTTKKLSLSRCYFLSALTWITEKELERAIKKGDEFRWKKNMKLS